MPRKSRVAQARERENLVAVLNERDGWQTHEEINAAFSRRTGRHLPYTTLRLRLDELLQSGRAERSPARRNMKYRAVRIGEPAPRASDEVLTLSPEAMAAQALLQRPRSERRPVGYDVEFLEAYVPGATWYLPTELRSRLEALGRTAYEGAPAGTYARDIMQRLIIDLSWGSSRLEGNKYSRIDTEELIQGGRAAPGASDADRQMILNHKAAIEFLVEGARDIAFNRYTLFNLHAILAENLVGGREGEGTLRLSPVAVGNSVYTPSSVPQVIEHSFDLILARAEAIPDPLEQSFFIMVHLPYLQPFLDVNKRTSRLAANIPLIRRNLCPLSFVDVPELLYTEGILAIYELKDVSLLRDVFAWAYQRSCTQFKVLREAMGHPDPIRLTYRTSLRAVVTDIVRSGRWPLDEQLISLAAANGVPSSDRGPFLDAVRRDIAALRADTLARYGLRPSEFEAWLTATGRSG